MAWDLLVSGVAVPEVLQSGRHRGGSWQNAAHGKAATIFGEDGFGEIHQASALGVGWHFILDQRLDGGPHGLVCGELLSEPLGESARKK